MYNLVQLSCNLFITKCLPMKQSCSFFCCCTFSVSDCYLQITKMRSTSLVSVLLVFHEIKIETLLQNEHYYEYSVGYFFAFFFKKMFARSVFHNTYSKVILVFPANSGAIFILRHTLQVILHYKCVYLSTKSSYTCNELIPKCQCRARPFAVNSSRVGDNCFTTCT